MDAAMSPAADPPDDGRLNELVTAALDALDRGDQGALDALLRDHPDEADVVKRRLALLVDVGVLGAGGEARPPERLGDYRILEQLGFGGMGVVYRAHDPKLDRDVALKVVRPERLFFEGTRERFKREVETVARLQHPGIVPVYDVGEAQGLPYFAMELVDGWTIERVLARASGRDPSTLEGRDLAPEPASAGYLFDGSWEAASMRVIEQVAQAIEHAHRRGVVHRDLKPSNILLTRGDAARAVVFDFGLATAVASKGPTLTHTGSRLGTLHYMAPEQVRGDAKSIDARTDVYALGVTLYQMLTLQPAFDGRSDADVILAIERGETKRVRALNPAVSWEAETVCARAMESEPSRRYASAADFARDLANVLDGRPIEARRAGALRRTRRWIERHPALAAAYALSTVIAIGGPLLWAWKEREASLEIRAQRDRAERNLAHSMEAVDRMLSRVGTVDLRFVPQMEPVRTALLEDAVKLLESFVAENEGDPRAAHELAKGRARLADLLEELGRNSDAAAARERELASYDALLAANPGSRELAVARAQASVALARVRVNSESVASTRPLLDQNARSIDALLAAAPGGPDAGELERVWIANQVALGKLLRLSGDPEASRAELKLAVERADRALERLPSARVLVEAANLAWNEYGYLLMESFTKEREVNQAAADALARAVTLCETLVRTAPEDGQAVTALAEARINLGGVWLRAGEFLEARKFYVAASADLTALHERFPNTLNYTFTLATACNQIGLTADWLRDYPTAEENYSRTLELLRSITRVSGEPNVLNRHGIVAYNLSSVKSNLAKYEEAEALTREAIDLQTRAVAAAPGNEGFAQDLAAANYAYCSVKRAQGDWRGAVERAPFIRDAAPLDAGVRWREMLAWVRCVDMIRSDPSLSDDERERTVESYAAQAVGALRAAIELGHPAAQRDLESLNDTRPIVGTAAWNAFVAERGRTPAAEGQ
jgi:tetratricopeptide (TPR) repeat protein/tRNA A-37 threonylcarbamoyl transferase component Bud32